MAVNISLADLVERRKELEQSKEIQSTIDCILALSDVLGRQLSDHFSVTYDGTIAIEHGVIDLMFIGTSDDQVCDSLLQSFDPSGTL